jgi:hypothetical protein
MKKRVWLGAALALAVLGCTGNPVSTGSNPHGLPTSVSLAMPDSLKTVSALKSVSAYRTSAYRAQAEDAFSLSEQIGAHLGIYVVSTELIDDVLATLQETALKPGEPHTFTQDGETLTVLLETKADHSVISIGEGRSAKGENQIIGISYTSPRKGRAVFRSREPMPGAGRFALETVFDLDAGKVSANGYSDSTMQEDPQEFCVHWEFKAVSNPPAGVADFTMRASAFFSLPNVADESGVYAMVANCLDDGSAAAILGVQTPALGNAFTLIPSSSNGDTSFFLGADGKDMTPAAARSDLKALVPKRQTIYEPFPADPSTMDVLALPIYQFPQ